MKTLVVGADREGIRFIVYDGLAILVDQYELATATQRNERSLLEGGMQALGLSWSDIDAYVALTVPHSHTSVRVIQTLLSTSAWYYGRPFQAMSCDTIQLGAEVIIDQLRSALAG